MGKKSKSPKKSGGSGRKMKKLLIRLVILIVVGGSLFVLYKPEVVQDEKSRERILGMRDQLSSIMVDANGKTHQIFQPLQTIAGQFDSIPNQIEIGDQEIYLDRTVSGISNQLEKLPIESYQRFKANFCSDAVATISAESSKSADFE